MVCGGPRVAMFAPGSIVYDEWKNGRWGSSLNDISMCQDLTSISRTTLERQNTYDDIIRLGTLVRRHGYN